MEPLISVIVPVYNVEPYLRKCVDSILNQMYRNLEIILVDDGSPDGCPAICDEYAEKDTRVRVIHKENGGQASARNLGLEIAQGVYIAFVDSDDWLDYQLYKTVMQYAPFDVALFGCTYYDSRTGACVENQACTMSKIMTWAEDTEDVRRIVHSSLFGYACNKVYSRQVVQNIRMPNAPMREDFLFNISAFKRTKWIQLVDYSGYYYNQHDESTLKKKYSGGVPDIAVVVKQMLRIHPDLPVAENNEIANSVVKQYICDSAYKYIFLNPTISENEAITALRRVFRNDDIAEYMHFSLKDGGLFFLLTLCIKMKAPTMFYRIVKRKWYG